MHLASETLIRESTSHMTQARIIVLPMNISFLERGSCSSTSIDAARSPARKVRSGQSAPESTFEASSVPSEYFYELYLNLIIIKGIYFTN